MESSEDTEKPDKLIYEIVLDRYHQEWGRTQDLDRKASSVTGFAGILATLATAIMKFLPESPYTYFLFIPIALFVLSVLCGLFGYWIMNWDALNPQRLIDYYSDRTKEEVLRTYTATVSEWTLNNDTYNEKKVKWIYRAFLVMVIAIVLFLLISLIMMMT
jgi:hypothetical protein